MDLFSVLEHEVGHLLGHDHDEVGVMNETLAAGERRSVGTVDVAQPWWLAAFEFTSPRDRRGW